MPRLVFNTRDNVPGRRSRNDKRTDAPLAGVFVRHGEDNGDVGVLARCYELLGSVELIVRTLTLRTRGRPNRLEARSTRTHH